MKVLGINFGGRPMRCGEIMVKEALFGAKEAGAAVEFIRTVNLRIEHCTGCDACSAHRARGGNVHCVKKDDYAALEEKVLDADGIILAAPVFSVGSTGQLKNFIDRFGAAHDRAFCEMENQRRIAAGKSGNDLLDPRYFKDRYVAYLSIGGADTPHWVSLGLPLMTEFGTSQHMKVVGQINANGQGQRANPVLDEALMAQCHELGKRVAEAVGTPYDQVEWYGEEGVCPYCHTNLIMMDKMPEVYCATCGAKGTLAWSDDKPIFRWAPEEEQVSRMLMAGLYDHYHEIEHMKEICVPKLTKYRELIEERLVKYREFDKFIQDI